MEAPLIVFAPGAGAPSASEWMRAWAQRLGELGTVVPFDYDYQLQQRRRPDPQPALVARHRTAIAQARAQHGGPLVLAGKSMGSRMGCHVSLEPEASVSALVCFGYPLQAAGTGKLRDQVLLQLQTPILFIQGTKDPLCPLPLLEALLPRMTARHELHVVDGGDHSLRISKRLPQEPVDTAILEAVRGFLTSVLQASSAA